MGVYIVGANECGRHNKANKLSQNHTLMAITSHFVCMIYLQACLQVLLLIKSVRSPPPILVFVYNDITCKFGKG
ncbi:hypothetical protein DPMN_141019 [Dreissena polymorpha]|uniref:Uncharacterized protein n=1 Tax=Dreissena polymorpha TaxID=45954 RepID=A0A9D4JKW7_DREPO|nr:hypothetical protein DPMN_141019 [Dreissena polymorpha]